jgi:hypothetical protein
MSYVDKGGNDAGGALQPGAAEKEFLEVPLYKMLPHVSSIISLFSIDKKSIKSESLNFFVRYI